MDRFSCLCYDIFIEILNYISDIDIIQLSKTSSQYQFVYKDYKIRDRLNRSKPLGLLNNSYQAYFLIYDNYKKRFCNKIWKNKTIIVNKLR